MKGAHVIYMLYYTFAPDISSRRLIAQIIDTNLITNIRFHVYLLFIYYNYYIIKKLKNQKSFLNLEDILYMKKTFMILSKFAQKFLSIPLF